MYRLHQWIYMYGFISMYALYISAYICLLIYLNFFLCVRQIWQSFHTEKSVKMEMENFWKRKRKNKCWFFSSIFFFFCFVVFWGSFFILIKVSYMFGFLHIFFGFFLFTLIFNRSIWRMASRSYDQAVVEKLVRPVRVQKYNGANWWCIVILELRE